MKRFFLIFTLLFFIPGLSGAVTLDKTQYNHGENIILTDCVQSGNINDGILVYDNTGRQWGGISCESNIGENLFLVSWNYGELENNLRYYALEVDENGFCETPEISRSACVASGHVLNTFIFTIGQAGILSLPISGAIDILSSAGVLFSDTWDLLALVIGLPFAFYIIIQVINLTRPK